MFCRDKPVTVGIFIMFYEQSLWNSKKITKFLQFPF